MDSIQVPIRAEDGRHSEEVVHTAPPEAVASPPKAAGDRFIFGLLLGITFLLPLFFLPNLGVSLEFAKYIFVSMAAVIAGGIWLALRLKDGQFNIPKSWILLSGVGLVVSYFVAAVFSPVFWVSFTGLLFDRDTFISTLLLFVLMFLASLAFRSSVRVSYFYASLFLSAAVIFLMEVIRLLFGVNTFAFDLFNFTGGNVVGKWNDLGSYFGLIAIISMMTLELVQVSQKIKIILYGFLAASLFMMLAVNFSFVWLLVGLFAAGLFVFEFMGIGFAGKHKKMPVLPLVLFVISAMFFGMTYFSSDSTSKFNLGGWIVEHLGLTQVEVRPSWSSTLQIAGKTLTSDARSFFFGSGPNRFANQWTLFKAPEINNTLFWNTDFHSGVGLIPSFIVTTGILGALAWLVFLALFLYRGTRVLLKRTADGHPGYFLAASFAASLYLWITAIFYVPSTVPFALAFLATGIFIGLLVESKNISEFKILSHNNQKAGFLATLIVIIGLISSVVAAYSLMQKTISVIAFADSQKAFAAGNIDKSFDDMSRATRLNGSDVYYRSLAQINIAKIQKMLQTPNIPPVEARTQFQALFAAAVDDASKATALDNTNALNWQAWGDIYAAVVPLSVEGAYENAAKSYDHAQKLAPQSPSVALAQARLEVAKGNITVARDAVNRAIALKGNYTDARFLLAQIEVAGGNIPKAIDQVAAAALQDQSNIGLWFQLGLLYYNQKDWANSTIAFEHAVSVNPQYANAKYFLGLTYFQSKRVQDAITQFEGVQQLNPDNAEVKKILENLHAGREPFANFTPPPQPPEKRAKPPVKEKKGSGAPAADTTQDTTPTTGDTTGLGN